MTKRKAAKRPDHIAPGTLPAAAARQLQAVYETLREKGSSKVSAAKQAWGAVKEHYYKRGSKWFKRKRPRSKNPSPQSPKLRDLGVVVKMGTIKSIVVEGEDGKHRKYKWRRPYPLLTWSKHQRALVWTEANPSRPKKGVPRGDAAAKTYKDFAGRQADSHQTVAIPVQRMKRLGRAIRIDYTEPYGRAAPGTTWFHNFPDDDYVWSSPGKPDTFAVSGPRLTVTERGIVN